MRVDDVQRTYLEAEGSSRSRPSTLMPTLALHLGGSSRSRPPQVDDDSSDDDHEDPSYEQEELRGSQLFDAPHETQTQVRLCKFLFP